MNIVNFQKAISPEIKAKIKKWLDLECTYTHKSILAVDLRWVCIRAHYKVHPLPELEKYISALTYREMDRATVEQVLEDVFYIMMNTFYRVDKNLSSSFRRNCYLSRIKNYLDSSKVCLNEIMLMRS